MSLGPSGSWELSVEMTSPRSLPFLAPPRSFIDPKCQWEEVDVCAAGLTWAREEASCRDLCEECMMNGLSFVPYACI